jgi:hypothetical protein
MLKQVVPLTPYTVNRLLALVHEMRQAQKLYFDTRASVNLHLAKKREADVDRLLWALVPNVYSSSPMEFEAGFYSAPEAVQEWFLEHPEFAGYTHVAPSGSLPPLNDRNLSEV